MKVDNASACSHTWPDKRPCEMQNRCLENTFQALNIGASPFGVGQSTMWIWTSTANKKVGAKGAEGRYVSHHALGGTLPFAKHLSPTKAKPWGWCVKSMLASVLCSLAISYRGLTHKKR